MTLLTIDTHQLQTSTTIPIRTLDLMKREMGDRYPDRDVLYPIKQHLADKLKKKIRDTFPRGRKYKIELDDEPMLVTSDRAVKLTYYLSSYTFLLNPEDAELNEIVHPKVFNTPEMDENVETLSGKVFKPHFDHKAMAIMPVLNPDSIIKYFERIE